MPLRPIDAIFVHPKQRLYVVYYRGELWRLPRMKIDDRSWQNRKPYTDDNSSLYLSIHQSISDPVLAQKLRTLDLPTAVRGSTLARFEAWWESQGFSWLKDRLSTGESPLAAHHTNPLSKMFDNPPTLPSDSHPSLPSDDKKFSHRGSVQASTSIIEEDVFADMLAVLTEEVLDQKL